MNIPEYVISHDIQQPDLSLPTPSSPRWSVFPTHSANLRSLPSKFVSRGPGQNMEYCTHFQIQRLYAVTYGNQIIIPMASSSSWSHSTGITVFCWCFAAYPQCSILALMSVGNIPHHRAPPTKIVHQMALRCRGYGKRALMYEILYAW